MLSEAAATHLPALVSSTRLTPSLASVVERNEVMEWKMRPDGWPLPVGRPLSSLGLTSEGFLGCPCEWQGMGLACTVQPASHVKDGWMEATSAPDSWADQ